MNQWIHVAGTYDGSTMKLWLDGWEVDALDVDINIPTNNVALRFGTSQTSESFYNGILDEVRISRVVRYTEQFTPAESFSLDANTVGLWHFDEGTGTTTYDDSANGNHGTLHGPTWAER